MNIFRKQSARGLGITSLMALLLVVAVTASSLGILSWVGARQQYADIEQGYATIAIPMGKNMTHLFGAGTTTYFGIDSRRGPDGVVYVGPRDAEEVVKETEYYAGADHRILLSAHVADQIPMSSGRMDSANYQNVLDSYCYNASVAAVECLDVISEDRATSDKTYTVSLRILDWVSRSSAYDIFPEDEIIVQSSVYEFHRDGTPLFEPGKTYLVRGFYDYAINFVLDTVTGELIEEVYHNLRFSRTYPGAEGTPHFVFQKATDRQTGKTYNYIPDNVWPLATMYTGTWQDFLKTDEGQVWRDEIIPYAEANQNSAPVILTDYLESMYHFNTGTASMVDGRTFTQEEYDRGERVCLVSADYATLNDLQIGDALNLDFYHNKYEIEGYYTNLNKEAVTNQRLPMMPSMRIGVQQDYTIVGIYTAPAWGGGVHDFDADTIFIPKASIPNAEQYATNSLTPMLHSVILRDGSIDEVEAHMVQNDMAGVYAYFDQGYSELEASLGTLLENARQMLTIVLPVFFLAVLVFLLLDSLRRGQVMHSMRLLGVRRARVFWEVWATVLFVSLIAVLLGNILGAAFLQLLTNKLLSAAVPLQPAHVLLCAGMQFLTIAILSAVWIGVTSGQKLMNRK